jgi:hypothetical protein
LGLRPHLKKCLCGDPIFLRFGCAGIKLRQETGISQDVSNHGGAESTRAEPDQAQKA